MYIRIVLLYLEKACYIRKKNKRGREPLSEKEKKERWPKAKKKQKKREKNKAEGLSKKKERKKAQSAYDAKGIGE